MDAGPQAVERDPPQFTEMEIRGLTKDQISSILEKNWESSKVWSVPMQVDCGPPAPGRYWEGEKKNWIQGIHAADGRLLGEIMWGIAFPNFYVHMFQKTCVSENW